MTSTELLMNRGRDKYRPLNSRASSATLFLGQHVTGHFDGPADRTDMIIAQGLLRRDSPQIPIPQSPCFSTKTAQQCHSVENDDVVKNRRLRKGASSNTWTSSSGAASDEDGNDDRTPFVEEYNRLAKKYGVQPIVPEEFVAIDIDKVTLVAKQGSWIMRKFLRRTSSIQTTVQAEKQLRHKRSVSDLSIRLRAKKDALKDKSLLELVRLCGTSALYLPAEYAASTLAVPTCFRATAQYLVQHAAASRGIFRIPGSHSTINALYNHYASQDDEGDLIRGTVRCPMLPDHISCSVHDVASAFKKFLAGLPGGILGKVWIFESTSSIYSHLDAAAEHTRTKQSKIRARLIALAVASIASRHQRELISAVFGLLSMIGRAAETAQREDEHGRPLPTSDLMGYKALGVVFGPLLIGDLLDSYDILPLGPHGCLALTQQVRPKPGKAKHRKNKVTDEPMSARKGAEKIRIVNSITEMLITHWRDVVRHMKNLGALGSFRDSRRYTRRDGRAPLRPSASESFAIRRPPDWDAEKISIRHIEGCKSPTPSSRKNLGKVSTDDRDQPAISPDGALFVRKRRPRPKPISTQILSCAKSVNVLSPTAEEVPVAEDSDYCTSTVEASQLKADSGEYDDVKPFQSAQMTYAGLSEGTAKSAPKIPVAVMKASPQEHNDSLHSVSAIVSDTVSLKTITTRTKYPKNQPDFQEQIQAKALIKQDSIALETRTPSEQNYNGSPTIERIKQISRRPNTITPSHGNIDQNTQLKRGIPSLVPTGMVSTRLQGINANATSDEPPSGFRMLLKTENVKTSQYPDGRAIRPGYSNTSQSRRNDPLAKISHEKDVASLVSLAEAMQSEISAGDQGFYSNNKALTRSASSISAHIFDSDSALSSHAQPESLVLEHPRSVEAINEFVIQVTPGRRTTSPGTGEKLGRIPRRSATESKVTGPRAASSVKALAARFNADASLPPLLTTAPEPQHVPRSQFESGVISPYTMNRSPAQRDHKLNKSSHSWRAAHNSVAIELLTPSRLQDRTSPLVSKPLLTILPRQNESKPPQWPILRPVPQTPPHEKLARTSSPFQVRSNLHRLGDGNVSFSISRKSSLALPSASKHPPLAESPHSTKISTPRKNHSISPFDISPSDSGWVNLRSDETSGHLSSLPKPRSRSATMLYSHMRQLQSQLKTKIDEAEYLKRQLSAQLGQKASCELGEQLRKTRRELENWRKRAEIAEKRLDVLSHRTQYVARQHGTGNQRAIEILTSNIISAFGEKIGSADPMREVLYGNGDQSAHLRSEIQGMVRRESPNSAVRSYNKADELEESKNHIPNDSVLDSSSWAFELE